MIFKYYMPTRFLFGQGALALLHKQELPGSKALIVISSGKSMRAGGYLDRLTAELDQAGVGWALFDKILPNPILDHVREGAALAMTEGCDFVIGLGGGSSIDSAKAIAVAAANPGHDFWEFMNGVTGGGKTPERVLPVVAITTTAGTGTEADPWFVITKPETREKVGGGFDSTYPVLSIVDADLMVSVPRGLTAYQGFDALFHSTECYLNKNANPINDILALDAIANVAEYLPRAIADGNDIEARDKVALANTEAGFTQSISGCISEHAMAHALSAYSPKFPHGAALISISLAYYKTMIDKGARPDRFIKMARVMGIKDASVPEDFLKVLADLQAACGVAELRMSEFGIREEDLHGIAENAHQVMGGMYTVDPVPFVLEDTYNVIKQSFK